MFLATGLYPEIKKKKKKEGLLWWSSGQDSELPVQGAQGSIPGQGTRAHML